MFIVTASVTIKKPIDHVFKFMLNPGNYPKWITMLRSVSVKGNFTTGMKFEEITIFRGKEKYSRGDSGNCFELEDSSAISEQKIEETKTALEEMGLDENI